MSYILEALKKAQAERQLGHAPDIHTLAPAQLPSAAQAPQRRGRWIAVGLGGALLIAAVLVWQWSGAPRPAPPALPAAPVAVAVAPAVPAPVVPAPVIAAPAVPAPVAPISAAPAPLLVAPEAPAAPSRKPELPAAPAVPAARQPAAAPVPVVAAAPVRAPEPLAEDALRTLQQLPEALQRELPKLAIGGYIYSPNPSERLLLVDKNLRGEGEELAPGLILEKLMPKYAVMNYRGTRYRVAY